MEMEKFFFKKQIWRLNYFLINRLQKYIIIGEKESVEKLVKSVYCLIVVFLQDWIRELGYKICNFFNFFLEYII